MSCVDFHYNMFATKYLIKTTIYVLPVHSIIASFPCMALSASWHNIVVPPYSCVHC